VMRSQAGAGLGRVDNSADHRNQTWTFPFAVNQSRAFLGEPRRKQACHFAVEAKPLDEKRREFSIPFPNPPSPGQTVTVVSGPFNNPSFAGIYQFACGHFPLAPIRSPAGGFCAMAIYNVKIVSETSGHTSQ